MKTLFDFSVATSSIEGGCSLELRPIGGRAGKGGGDVLWRGGLLGALFNDIILISAAALASRAAVVVAFIDPYIN